MTQADLQFCYSLAVVWRTDWRYEKWISLSRTSQACRKKITITKSRIKTKGQFGKYFLKSSQQDMLLNGIWELREKEESRMAKFLVWVVDSGTNHEKG